MKRILVIEPDEKYAQRLLTVLKAANLYTISMVKTMREAALLLAQQSHDLALAPLADGENLVKSLRAVQADLRIVLTTTAAGQQQLPAGVQGSLLMPLLEVDLPALVGDALTQELKASAPAARSSGVSLDLTPIKEILQQNHWPEPMQAAVLSYGSKRLVSWGVLSKPELSALVSEVDHHWRSQPRQPQETQILFWSREADSANSFVVYTRPTIYGLLLTIVAVSQLTITELRLQADGVAAKLNGLALPPAAPETPIIAEPLTPSPPPLRPKNGATTAAPPAPTGSGKTYAAIWRAAQPLAAAVLPRLEAILQEISQENGCLIKNKLLQADLVHLVVTCPPGRSSAWTTHLLKQQSETRLKEEFELEGSVWSKGYYASETNALLSESEIQLFLEKEQAK